MDVPRNSFHMLISAILIRFKQNQVTDFLPLSKLKPNINEQKYCDWVKDIRPHHQQVTERYCYLGYASLLHPHFKVARFKFEFYQFNFYFFIFYYVIMIKI